MIITPPFSRGSSYQLFYGTTLQIGLERGVIFCSAPEGSVLHTTEGMTNARRVCIYLIPDSFTKISNRWVLLFIDSHADIDQ